MISVCPLCGEEKQLVEHHIVPRNVLMASIFGHRLEHPANKEFICDTCNTGKVKSITYKILKTKKLLLDYHEIIDQGYSIQETTWEINKLFISLLSELRNVQGFPYEEFNNIHYSRDSNFVWVGSKKPFYKDKLLY